MLRRCLELPGQDLLQYLDGDGQPHAHRLPRHQRVPAPAYRRGFQRQDYRTWAGSALALERLRRAEADGLGAVVAEVAAGWATAWRSAGNATSTRRSSGPTRPGRGQLRRARKRRWLSAEEATLLAFLDTPG